jgi:hypothetical protein
MDNYKKHAMSEFQAAGWCDSDGKFECEMQEMICNHVLALLDVFAGEGRSGSSAPYAINLFKTLANFEPITPITCMDDEWNEVGDNTYQNNRFSGVFKDTKEGKPYYIDAVVFREANGSCFTGTVDNITSRQYIRLPFTPKTFYIDVDSWEVNKDNDNVLEPGSGWWVSNIKDRTQLEEVFKYYDKYEQSP